MRLPQRLVEAQLAAEALDITLPGRGRLIKKTENAYPRPRDRRLPRKTRAAVGTPPARAEICPAVRSADKFGECLADVCLPQSTTAVARRKKLAQDRSCLRWLSQPG